MISTNERSPATTLKRYSRSSTTIRWLSGTTPSTVTTAPLSVRKSSLTGAAGSNQASAQAPGAARRLARAGDRDALVEADEADRAGAHHGARHEALGRGQAVAGHLARRRSDHEGEALDLDARLALRLDLGHQLGKLALGHVLGIALAQGLERALGLVGALQAERQTVAQLEIALLEAQQIGFELRAARLAGGHADLVGIAAHGDEHRRPPRASAAAASRPPGDAGDGYR